MDLAAAATRRDSLEARQATASAQDRKTVTLMAIALVIGFFLGVVI